jgi:DNA mismatch repair protein MutL
MTRIRVLDEEVANKIAAGEVVERPASVVKELVENAVDAGATRVSVELQDGGRRRIQVTDNGCGMTAEEAVLALQRHATSKIERVEDLASLRTLGFRGEALPSIASVSRLTLLTRPRESLGGIRLEVEGGEIRSVEEVGAPEGTTFVVHDLFYNTPARLKFLKSARAELGQASDWLVRIALAHPEITVRLASEGVEALRSPGSPDRLETIGTLYGREVARELLPVAWEHGGIRIEGYIARPTFTRPTRSGQSFFVNGRFVRNRTLSHALDDAYRAALPSGRFPFAVLLIETDPAVVDVNVHPTKAEVRFLREWEFHRAVNEAVKATLGTEAPAPAGSFAVEALVSQEHLRHAPWIGGAGGATRRDLWPGLRPATPLPPDPNDPFADPPLTATVPVSPPADQPVLPETHAPPALRLVAQIWSSYILAEGATGLVIIDQHLAHERILFDRLTAARDSPSAGSLPEGDGGGEPACDSPMAPSQRLTTPVTLTLSHPQALLVEEHLDSLRAMGFDLEAFGRDAFVLRAVPAFVRPGQEKALLHEMMEEMADTETQRSSPRQERVAAATACRAAIKKGERLAREEIQRLLEDLARSSNPHTCPHGCPIAVEISYQELLKRFKRV